MSLNELLSSLRDIAFHALPDSELYGCALAVKAFAELYRVSSQDQREELFKIVDTCFCGNLTEIEKRFSSRRDEVAKHFLEKLRELHKVKDVKFPHLDVYSILLLSESFDKVMQKHSDAAHISIYLGKRLVSLISFLEKSETEKALEDLLDYEYPFTDELLSSIRETIERYRSKRIDDRFDFLRQEFEKYDLNRNVLKLSEMWLREKMKISCEKILCYLISGRRNGITYILGSSRPIKIRQDSVKVSIFCNFWPLFLCCQTDSDCPAQDNIKGKCDSPSGTGHVSGSYTYTCVWPPCAENKNCVDNSCCTADPKGPNPGGTGVCVSQGIYSSNTRYLCDPPNGWNSKETKTQNILELIISAISHLFFQR